MARKPAALKVGAILPECFNGAAPTMARKRPRQQPVVCQRVAEPFSNGVKNDAKNRPPGQAKEPV